MTIHVISGPPCAGKTTYVARHRHPDRDVVLDLDTLAHALGYPAPHLEWGTTHPAKTAALIARASLLKVAMAGRLDGSVYIIDSAPNRETAEKYLRAGARTHVLDPGSEACHTRARAAGRPDATHEEIDRWYREHAPTRCW